jgi:cyclin A
VLVGEYVLLLMYMVSILTYLANPMINYSHLQRYSACTLIASKLLEITPPTVQDFCYISDNSYTTKEILECEAEICSALKFNFNYGTTYKYIDHFLRASFATPNGKAKVQKKMMEWMVFYFLDLSLLDYKFVGIKPSLVAAAAVYLARATLGIREVPSVSATSSFIDPTAPMFQSIQRCSAGFWTKTLQHYTGYDKWDLEEPVKPRATISKVSIRNSSPKHLERWHSKLC